MPKTSPSRTFRAHRTTGILSPHGSPAHSSSEYQLERLEPRSDHALALLDDTPSQAELVQPTSHASGRRESTSSNLDSPGSATSYPKPRQLPLFPGPPPPISASTMMVNASGLNAPNSRHVESIRGLRSSFRTPGLESSASPAPYSALRGLRSKQRGLEQDIQRLLDLQAKALMAGATGDTGTRSADEGSGRGEDGSTTDTGAPSSEASVGSRMPKSLYIAPRSTPEGNVIPVRQPYKPRHMGLPAVRSGLRESLADLADLKREEDAQANAALAERKIALARLDGLCTRRTGICDALKALENNVEEPLGQELRKLQSEHDSLDNQIRQLEERLLGMRNRRRWLRERVEDVKSKREAGLSGYRGALRDVDEEVSAILHRPPVQPLDQEIIGRDESLDDEAGATGRFDFMQLIPQRRTVEMARAWWGAEVKALELQRVRIGEEQQALEQGIIVWQEVVSLVTRFESRLREAMKAGASAQSLASGGDEAAAQEDVIRRQLPVMGEVVAGLAKRMQLAEGRHWNLLICAIGAEWEAFKEAHDVLKSIVDGANGTAGDRPRVLNAAEGASDGGSEDAGPGQDDVHAESDNEVPADLLVSHPDDMARGRVESQTDLDTAQERRDSENTVPPGFLAEHGHSRGL